MWQDFVQTVCSELCKFDVVVIIISQNIMQRDWFAYVVLKVKVTTRVYSIKT